MSIFALCMGYQPTADDIALAELDYRLSLVNAKAASGGAAHSIAILTDDWLEYCRAAAPAG